MYFKLLPGLKMDEKESSKTISEPNFLLFPASSNSFQHTPLFPASNAVHIELQTPKTFDWLENKSFDPDAITEVPQKTEVPQRLEVQQQIISTDQENERGILVNGAGEEKKGEEQYDDDIDSDRKRKKKSKSKHRHKKHKHKTRSPSPSKHKHKTRSPSLSKELAPQGNLTQSYGKKIFMEQIPGLEFRDAYRIDRKADADNWRFGSIYKEHIAKYHLLLDYCIGHQSNQIIHLREQKKGKKIEKSEKLRYFGKENRRLIRSAPIECIHISSDLDRENTQSQNLISLFQDSRKNMKSDLSQNGADYTMATDIRDQLMDSRTKDYVQGKAPSIKPEDQSSLVESNYNINNKVAEYNKLLREQPHNTTLWLEFVKFQDIVHGEGSVLGKEKTPKQALLDRKISILQKALESNPACIELKLKYLEYCEEIWDKDKVNKEIEQLLFTHPTDIRVWKFYLTFNQSRLSVFSVSRVTKLYYKCLTKLLSYRDGQVQSHQTSDTLHQDILDIFVQFCHFLKQSGHTERAIATFQGMIEFNLFCPSKLQNLSIRDKIAVFESFWDSGVSRIGENGAKGWNFWMDNKDHLSEEESPIKSDSSEEKEQEVISKQQQKWKTWLDIEILRESSHLLPWRPDLSKDETEEDCEDMDRLVLFDDISSALFSIPENLYIELVLQFLILLDVDIGSHFVLNSQNLNHEQLNLYSLHQVLIDNEVKNGVQCHFMSKEILSVFISNVLKQLITYFSGCKKTLLTVIWLNIQLVFHRGEQSRTLGKNERKEIKRFAKSLLKLEHNRNNLVVWSTYAEMLWCLLQKKEAEEIILTALSMFTCKDEDLLQISGLMALHRIYVETILNFESQELGTLFKRNQSVDEGQYIKAQQVLVCLAEGQKFDSNKPNTILSTELLKARHKLHTKVDLNIEKMKDSFGNDSEFKMYFCELVKCAALFEYCFNGVHSAVSSLDNVITNVHRLCNQSAEDITLTNIELCKYKIKLIIHHMTTMNAPLKLLRSAIDGCLEYFPSTVYFLTVLVDIEAKSNIAGRLHRYFGRSLKNLKSPIQPVVYVYSQLKRQSLLEQKVREGLSKQTVRNTKNPLVDEGESVVMETGLIHRIRSYLEKALEYSQTRHCPLLWRLYLHAEVKFGYKEQAQGVLYRALQQCPWSKILYLDGVALFGENKLEEMVDLMMEKEIRVQIPVEEIDILTGTDTMETLGTDTMETSGTDIMETS